MSDELKPCPFCGASAKICVPIAIAGDETYYVNCTQCRAFVYSNSSEEDAISEWNRRVDTKTN